MKIQYILLIVLVVAFGVIYYFDVGINFSSDNNQTDQNILESSSESTSSEDLTAQKEDTTPKSCKEQVKDILGDKFLIYYVVSSSGNLIHEEKGFENQLNDNGPKILNQIGYQSVDPGFSQRLGNKPGENSRWLYGYYNAGYIYESKDIIGDDGTILGFNYFSVVVRINKLEDESHLQLKQDGDNYKGLISYEFDEVAEITDCILIPGTNFADENIKGRYTKNSIVLPIFNHPKPEYRESQCTQSCKSSCSSKGMDYSTSSLADDGISCNCNCKQSRQQDIESCNSFCIPLCENQGLTPNVTVSDEGACQCSCYSSNQGFTNCDDACISKCEDEGQVFVSSTQNGDKCSCSCAESEENIPEADNLGPYPDCETKCTMDCRMKDEAMDNFKIENRQCVCECRSSDCDEDDCKSYCSSIGQDYVNSYSGGTGDYICYCSGNHGIDISPKCS